jgi:hypothetical protein
MKNLKQFMFLSTLAIFFGVVLSIAVTSIIAWHADNLAKEKIILQNETLYYACIKEKYPTLEFSLLGFVDTRTGTRYNVSGTQQDILCRARVFGK